MSEPSGALLAALERAAGAGALVRHAPLDVDGCGFDYSLRPPDASALASCLAELTEAGTGVVVRGGGTRLAIGNAPRGAALLLDTRGLAGVESFEAAEGVCRAGAGTPLAAVREKVRAGGWELPLDAPGSGATLGGVIASGAFGPRAQGYGVPRDVVLGLDVALASGERTRCGGRVVKNVTGYDLCKLYTGSFGALGVIEAAWLRLRPLPEATCVLEARGGGLGAVLEAALGVARRVATRAVAVHVPARATGGEPRCVVELAGDAVAVEDERAAVAAALAAQEAASAALDELRALQGAGACVVRVSALPNRVAAAAEALQVLGAELLVYPGVGVLQANFDAVPTDAFAGVRALAAQAGGALRVERAPLALKQTLDVFAAAPGVAGLQRELKARFDPAGVLNPGRGAGAP